MISDYYARSIALCRGVHQPQTTSNDVGQAGRAIKDPRGLRGASIIMYHCLREAPPHGVAEKGVWSYIIYILIYDTSTPPIF